MRAVVIEDCGVVPRVRERPTPEPGPGEVRIRVHASSVNGFDALLASGALREMYPHRFPITLGKDFSGTVDEVGDEVAGFALGDHVFGVVSAPLPTQGGGFAEYLTTAAGTGITRLPAGLDHATAGRLGLAGATAFAVLAALAPEPDQTVLVSGAAGGVGTLVVQLAAAHGATVLATSGATGGSEELGDLGARYVVGRRGLAAQVRRLAPAGTDAVVHLAGDPMELADLVRPGGRMVSALHVGQAQLAGRNLTATAVMADPSAAVLDRVAAEVAAGRLHSPVTRTYRLDEVPDALVGSASTGPPPRRAGGVGKRAVQVGA